MSEFGLSYMKIAKNDKFAKRTFAFLDNAIGPADAKFLEWAWKRSLAMRLLFRQYMNYDLTVIKPVFIRYPYNTYMPKFDGTAIRKAREWHRFY